MNDSVAIVTGASQGIGRSTSIRLARDFSAIVLVARNAMHSQRSQPQSSPPERSLSSAIST